MNKLNSVNPDSGDHPYDLHSEEELAQAFSRAHHLIRYDAAPQHAGTG